MLKYLHLRNVGLAPELRVEWAPRLNLITGDNGLGKSFFLDLAWWALTRTWAGAMALPPLSAKSPMIEYLVQGKAGEARPVVSKFRRSDGSWPVDAKRPPMPGIVIYIRIDGGFSVWDPARNYWRNDPGRPAAYHFTAAEVWEGLDIGGQRVCEGLERDWINWQEGQKKQFDTLEEVLKVLSPVAETLRAGPPQRLFIGEGRDRPTLLIGDQTIPIFLASAGIRRILALAYFLVWAWHEHHLAAKLLGKRPESRVVILFDEPETHLHPRWQRTIVPSVLAAVDTLRERSDAEPQVLLASHAPLIAASLEPLFDTAIDDVVHLQLERDTVLIRQGIWVPQGDITNWLVSETFGLDQARSLDAEQAVEAAEALMRGDLDKLPEGLASRADIHEALTRLLPAHDHFWPRWIVSTQQMPENQRPHR